MLRMKITLSYLTLLWLFAISVAAESNMDFVGMDSPEHTIECFQSISEDVDEDDSSIVSIALSQFKGGVFYLTEHRFQLDSKFHKFPSAIRAPPAAS